MENYLFTIVFITNLFLNIHSSPTLVINNGELIIKNAINCVITVNKDYDNQIVIKNITGNYNHDKYIFGILDYTCDETFGTMLSEYNCKDCGLFCSYNQMFLKCKSSWIIFVMSSVISLLICIIILLILKKHLNEGARYICEELITWYHVRKIRHEYRTAKTFNNMSPSSNLKLKDRTNGYSTKISTGVNKKRDALNSKLANHRADLIYEKIEDARHGYITCIDVASTSVGFINETRPRSIPNYTPIYPALSSDDVVISSDIMSPLVKPRVYHTNMDKKKSTSSISLSKLVVGGLLLSGLHPSEGCDNNLFINSLGQVCDENTCKEVDMFTMPIQSGQSICFKDTDNNDFVIKIEKSYIINRYIKMYYTSDWEIVTTSYYSCKGTSQCWHGGCNYDTIGDRFVQAIGSSLESYGCLSSALGCDTTCWHKLSCTYFKWTVKPLGSLIPVYKQENSLWEVVMQISYKNFTKTAVLNVNNPSLGLDSFSEVFSANIPIYITNFMSEQVHQASNLVISNGNIIPIAASDLNMPESDKMGDYQVSLDLGTTTFNYQSVDCKVESCEVKCFHPIPKVRKIQKIMNNYKDNSVLYSYSAADDIIKSEKMVLSTVTLMIGNLKMRNLQVTPAYCTIIINTVYGCKGCDKLPYLVYSPINIKQEGTLTFESNCTFSKNYLSCNPGNNILIPTMRYDACIIYIQKTNQTINVNFEYEFLGEVDPNLMFVSKPTLTQELKEVVTDKNFWHGLLSTFTLFTGLSVVLSLIMRAFKIYQLRKMTTISNTP